MTQFDSTIPAEIEQMFQDLGMDATLKWKSGSTYDPSTREVTSGEGSEVVRASPPTSYSKNMIAEQVVQAGDVEIFIGATEHTPSPGDKLEVGEETFELISVDPIRTGLITVAYQLQCRK